MILMHSFFVGRLSYLTAGLLLGWLAVANSACAGDWPSYGADAGRSFATSEQLALPLAPAWRYQTPAPPQPAWPEPGKELHRIDFDYCFEPVAAGGLLLFGSSTDDCVRALDLDTGELRWRFATGGPVRFAPAIAAGRCYIASDDGTLYCVDLRTGRLNWKFLGGPDGRLMIGNGRMISRWPLRSGVLVHEGIVYCTAGIWPSEGVFAHALRAADGEVVWTNDTCGLQYVDTAHAPAWHRKDTWLPRMAYCWCQRDAPRLRASTCRAESCCTAIPRCIASGGRAARAPPRRRDSSSTLARRERSLSRTPSARLPSQ